MYEKEKNDNGWNEILKTPKELENSFIREAVFLDENSLFCMVDYQLYSSNLSNVQVKYYICSFDGKCKEISGDLQDKNVFPGNTLRKILKSFMELMIRGML